MSHLPHHDFDAGPWTGRLGRLAEAIRRAAEAQLGAAAGEQGGPRPVAQGVGDVTYALDRATETAVEGILDELASEGPLSLFTEDAGWRHRGPSPGGATADLDGFDHGGPRIVIDPVDGTRNLMADLRSAWTVIGLAPPGRGEPRLAELELGLVSELPDSRAARFRTLSARRGAGARLTLRDRADGATLEDSSLVADADDRVDHGYFSFFRYTPALRPLLGRLEASFFSILAEEEGADTRHCFEDQYISNGGQLVLLSLGTYRFVADLRAQLAARVEGPVTTAKPYDCAGALLVAREAGCVVTAADGAQLDFPLDGSTPVSFVGYANATTAARLGPHLARALEGAN